jgi:hypothetical protein
VGEGEGEGTPPLPIDARIGTCGTLGHALLGMEKEVLGGRE